MNMVEVVTPEQEGVVDAVLQLPVDDIEVFQRIGFFHPDKAAALGRLIATDGQHEPIKVVQLGRGRWRLVAGLHRLEGIKGEGLRSVDAIEVRGTVEELRQIEASENLHRRTFGPLERAKFVRAIADAAEERLKAAHGDLTPQELGAKSRWAQARNAQGFLDEEVAGMEAECAAASLAGAYGWQESVADALGMSERAIRRDLAIYRGLIEPFPYFTEQLASHPLGDNATALREMCRIDDKGDRFRVLEALLTFDDMTVAEAKAQVGLGQAKAPLSPTDKHTNAVRSGWSRLSVRDQRAFLPEFVGLLTPGMRDDLRQLLDGAEVEA